jgi:hypothetical protein
VVDELGLDELASGGEDEGYVPCDELAAALVEPDADALAISGFDGAYSPPQSGASALVEPDADSLAISGFSTGFVAKPCEEEVYDWYLAFAPGFHGTTTFQQTGGDIRGTGDIESVTNHGYCDPVLGIHFQAANGGISYALDSPGPWDSPTFTLSGRFEIVVLTEPPFCQDPANQGAQFWETGPGEGGAEPAVGPVMWFRDPGDGDNTNAQIRLRDAATVAAPFAWALEEYGLRWERTALVSRLRVWRWVDPEPVTWAISTTPAALTPTQFRMFAQIGQGGPAYLPGGPEAPVEVRWSHLNIDGHRLVSDNGSAGL